MGGGYYGRGLLRVGLFNLIFFTFFIFNKSRGHTGGWGWGGGTGMTPALFFWPSRLGALLLLQYPERPQRPVLIHIGLWRRQDSDLRPPGNEPGELSAAPRRFIFLFAFADAIIVQAERRAKPPFVLC